MAAADDGGTRSAADQASMARSLQPHRRHPTTAEHGEGGGKVESLTPLPARRSRQLKWQFGIRSRNQPLDAMYCLFRALQRAGAEWQEATGDDRSWHGSIDVGDHATASDWSGDDEASSEGKERHRRPAHPPSAPPRVGGGGGGADRGADADDDASQASSADSDDSAAPDPWLIRCRWLKDGMRAATSAPSSSHVSSNANLVGGGGGGTSGGPGGAAGAAASAAPSSPDGVSPDARPPASSSAATGSRPGSATTEAEPTPAEKAYVYMDIQLYQIERDFYLVDFKCAGYERVDDAVLDSSAESSPALGSTTGAPTAAVVADATPKKMARKQRKGAAAPRFKVEEKNVSSPFPFLDLTSRLIIALAEGD
ncbi:MAG: Protein kinase [Phylliscum demangeonii]|nr:MAG: Protein kinase [Phylliscum demangeonii]